MTRTRCKTGWWMVAGVSLAVLAGCQSGSAGKPFSHKAVLWNGKDFTGWTRVLADPSINVDDVWQVRDGVLYCAGKPNGYMRTQKKYADYHLHAEWRWPAAPANSGVFLHATGPDRVWPVCIECQLKAGNAGDFVLMNGAALTVDGKERRNPAQQFVAIKRMNPATERLAGQWNSYDIECRGGSIRCFVNGVLQNQGTKANPASGWICLQSEGGPIEFRNLYLETK
jgi:hypothetical protein